MNATIRSILSCVFLAILCVSAQAKAAAPTSTPAPKYVEATVAKISGTQLEMTLAGSGTVEIDKASIPHASVGDRAILKIAPGNPTVVKTITARVTTWGYRAGVFLVSFLAIVLFAAAVTKGRPREFLIGADRRYSNSKVQLSLWFTTVMAAYFATLYLRDCVAGGDYLGGVDIPTNLLVLSGLSALTYAGAKAITTQKIDTIVAKGAVSPKTQADAPNILKDLFQNDLGEADLGDFQMILVTLVAVTVFICSVMNFLAFIELKTTVHLPEADTTLLSAFGIGQGAYLVKKMASDPGQG